MWRKPRPHDANNTPPAHRANLRCTKHLAARIMTICNPSCTSTSLLRDTSRHARLHKQDQQVRSQTQPACHKFQVPGLLFAHSCGAMHDISQRLEVYMVENRSYWARKEHVLRGPEVPKTSDDRHGVEMQTWSSEERL